MKRLLLPVNKVALFLLIALSPFLASAQGKVTINKKPSAVSATAKPVKVERIKSKRHLKKKAAVKRVSDNPSQDDKKLEEIKKAKARERGLK